LLLVGALLDAQTTIGVAFGDMRDIKGSFHINARIVLAHPGVDMRDIKGHHLAQTWDFLA